MAIRGQFQHTSQGVREQTCITAANVTKMIIEKKFYDEFDDLINSLKDERVTSKIFPPPQLYKLVAHSPELHDTIYVKSPYLIYHTGRFSFNLHEFEAGEGGI